MSRLYLGIDPGLNGAFAFIPEDGDPWFEDMPKIDTGKKDVINPAVIAEILERYARKVTMVGVERLRAWPGPSNATMFILGYHYGLLLGVLAACRMPYTEVSARVWKSRMMHGMTGQEKESSVLRASQLFPNVADQMRTKRGKALHDRADALLIGEYVRRDHKGHQTVIDEEELTAIRFGRR